MKHIKFPVAALTALSTSIISTPGFSQDTVVDDVIIVTANRRPQPLSQVGSSVSVLTSEDIERNQQSFVLDALETVPGVAISQNGSFGGTASVSLRGIGGDRTVLMVDGVQLNDASAPGSAFNFSTLDTFNIERIEVLRGPQSILYGSDAIGGVINIITKKGGDGLGGKMFIEGGSFNTQRGGASIYGGDDKYGFNLSASGINTDGISAADENDGNTESDGLRNYTFTGKVNGQLTETFELEAHANYSDSHSLYDAFGPIDGTLIETSDIENFSGLIRGNLDLLDGRFLNTLSVEYSQIDRLIVGNFGDFTGKGRRTNFDYLGVYNIDADWTITSGLQHEKVKSVDASDLSFDISSVFGEIGYTGIDGLTLTAGGRYDDHTTFGDTTTFRVTGSYEFDGTGTRLIANVGEGFKAPSISQLTFQCLTCVGLNNDLKPERSIGYEVGVEQTLLNNWLKLSATYFDIKIKDKITYINFSEGYTNIEEIKSKGIELSVDADVTDTLRVSGSYTYTDPKNATTNEFLRREPKNLFNGSINWQPTGKISATLNIIHNGEELIRDGDFSDTVSAWTRVDFRMSYEIMEGLNVYGRIDNLFNEEYQYLSGYGTPDRSYFAGLRKEF